MKKNLHYLKEKKSHSRPITMATAYDYPTAQLEEAAELDCILIGDSVGTNVLGYASEREVTMQDMIHHTAAVARAVKNAYIIADLPYRSADNFPEAERNASLLIQSGADCVKVEGWGEKQEIIKGLHQKGFAVCAHIGYNPQLHDKPRTFGKDAGQALELIHCAESLQNAGADIVVLEKLPQEVASLITKHLTIPTIGIGSGNGCDGQVLVVNDILGLSPRKFKHVQQFASLKDIVKDALSGYVSAVESKTFPSEENTWYLNKDEYNLLKKRLGE
ncbi:MAG: 3-methyl-2-oxobutanoate hydroxymethyltransferase [Chitinispirillaceae bacterium]